MTGLFLLLAALLGALGRRLAGGAFQQWTGFDVGDLPVRIAFAALIVAAAFLGGWTPHMLTVLPIGAAGVSVPLAIIPAWCVPMQIGRMGGGFFISSSGVMVL